MLVLELKRLLPECASKASFRHDHAETPRELKSQDISTTNQESNPARESKREEHVDSV